MNAKLVASKTLNKITESERKKVLVAYLQEQIAKLVGIEASDVEEQQPLQYLGIDSLIAVKLRNRLRTDLSVDVSAVEFMADSSLADLAVVVSQLLNQSLGEISVSAARQQDEHNEPKSYPLTYGQQGLWFLYKLAPESAAYNLSFTAHICSSLDVSALQRAIQKLVNRHATLRTVFKQQGGEPFQKVCQDLEVKIKQIDASDWKWDELHQEAIAAHREPFDLERGSLLRVNLFTCSEQDHFLLLGIHHIAIDGFSLGILVDELRLLYQSESTGQAISLPPIERQYGRFVQWQKEMLESSIGETHRSYWHQKLSGELPLLKLPVANWQSRDRPTNRGYYEFELDPHLAKQLRGTIKTEGVTLYMLMLTAFKVLLHHYTGQEDIIVGSPSEGRSQSEFSQTIGFFINMIALRSEVKSELTFSELLSQVRQTVLEALTHQDYPSTLIIESLQLNKDTTLSGLFQVVFNLLKLSDLGEDYELSMSSKAERRNDWGGLSLDPFVIPQQEGQYDEGHYNLGLDIVETRNSVFGIFRYDADLFDQAAIERMSKHFRNLLTAIVADREQAIGLLPMLGQTERHQLLVEWNDTASVYPRDKCVHQLFEEQVKKTPDAIAVAFDTQQLTYEQLDRKAEQLSHYLKDLGVKPEILVGICCQRSVEMVVGMLGILKSGGVYVPIDPTYPVERLNYIINDASVELLLTQKALSDRLPKNKVKVLYLDESIFSAPIISSDKCSLAKPHNLAYVIYTSGSTGRPKGVEIEHRGCVNHCYAMIDSLDLDLTDTIAQTAPIGFDISVWQILTVLLVGGKVEIIKNDIMRDPTRLCQEIQTRKISILQVVPSLLKVMLEVFEQSKTPSLAYLRWVSVTGETFPANLLDWWFELYPDIPLMNAYGPAECSDDVTLHSIYHSENLEL